MSEFVSPYSKGGGGSRFENLVGLQYATNLLSGRLCSFGEQIEEIAWQTDRDGFDDIRLAFVPDSGLLDTIDIQCRHRQAFTGGDSKFQDLVADSVGFVREYEGSVPVTHALAIVVDWASPANRDMRDLCDLARSYPTLEGFQANLDVVRGKLFQRWKHAQKAAKGLCTDEELFRALQVLRIDSVDIEQESSPARIQILEELSSFWPPPDRHRGIALVGAIFEIVTELNSSGGHIDRSQLLKRLGPLAPPTSHTKTRRERLKNLAEAGVSRSASVIGMIGLEPHHASNLARRLITEPTRVTTESSIAVVTGPIGIGKTTELERHHRRAIEQALDNPKAPLPIHVLAAQIATESLESIVERERAFLSGEPSAPVALTIDGLDEVDLTLERILPTLNTLTTRSPGSTVLISTRATVSKSIKQLKIPKLTDEEATALIDEVRKHRAFHVHGRPERVEMLQRPLFALYFAISGNTSEKRKTEAELIDSIARQACSEVKPAVFEKLIQLAVKCLNQGGGAVPQLEVALLPAELNQLLKSRIVVTVDGKLRFQLAVLTEWFACFALLRTPDLLEETVSSPTMARRWRYAHAQALRQSDEVNADRIMACLTEHSPGTAAWVSNEAKDIVSFGRANDFAPDIVTPKSRILLADSHWYRTLAKLPDLHNPSNPEIEFEIETIPGEVRLGTRPRGTGGPTRVQSVFSRDNAWWWVRQAQPRDSGKWIWEWTLDSAIRTVDKWLENGASLNAVPAARAELAFDFAHHILDTSHRRTTEPIRIEDLEAVIRPIREQAPDSRVTFVRGSRKLDLQEAELFVASLKSWGWVEVKSPWPTPDRLARWVWDNWSPEQLLKRLTVSTKAALNIYQQLVDSFLPDLKPSLNTYAMLPARVLGSVAFTDDEGWEGQPRIHWRLQPLPPDQNNDALWTIANIETAYARTDWNELSAEFEAVRGRQAQPPSFTVHGGLPGIYESRPAGLMALDLLSSDLKAIKWCTTIRKLDSSVRFAPIDAGPTDELAY